MIEREIEIINKLGLHARAAAKLVKLASSFESNILISRQADTSGGRNNQNKTINGKSIMGVMMLAAGKGSRILLKIDGKDEQLAVEQLVLLFEQRFGEAE